MENARQYETCIQQQLSCLFTLLLGRKQTRLRVIVISLPAYILQDLPAWMLAELEHMLISFHLSEISFNSSSSNNAVICLPFQHNVVAMVPVSFGLRSCPIWLMERSDCGYGYGYTTDMSLPVENMKIIPI